MLPIPLSNEIPLTFVSKIFERTIRRAQAVGRPMLALNLSLILDDLEDGRTSRLSAFTVHNAAVNILRY
tara:strand:- start:9 stop:215 length:207 start_codon:yes stop_codon:yes gene_type:complete